MYSGTHVLLFAKMLLLLSVKQRQQSWSLLGLCWWQPSDIQNQCALGRASLIHLVWSDSDRLTLNWTLFTRQRVNGSVWTVGCSYFSSWNMLILRSKTFFWRGTQLSTQAVQTPTSIKTKHHVDYWLGQSWVEVKASQLAGVKSHLN